MHLLLGDSVRWSYAPRVIANLRTAIKRQNLRRAVNRREGASLCLEARLEYYASRRIADVIESAGESAGSRLSAVSRS